MLHGYAMVRWNIHETQVRRYGTEIVEGYIIEYVVYIQDTSTL
jgi:hypothetical protein